MGPAQEWRLAVWSAGHILLPLQVCSHDDWPADLQSKGLCYGSVRQVYGMMHPWGELMKGFAVCIKPLNIRWIWIPCVAETFETVLSKSVGNGKLLEAYYVLKKLKSAWHSQ